MAAEVWFESDGIEHVGEATGIPLYEPDEIRAAFKRFGWHNVEMFLNELDEQRAGGA